MLWPESVRDLDRLAEASARVHMARSMQPDFRPTILSRARFVSPWSHTVSPGDGNSLDHYSLPGFGFMPRFVTGCLFFLLLMSPGVFAQEWRSYGGDVGGTRFSTLRQINRSNVARLKRAWTYHMGEMDRGANETDRHHVAPFESTPLVIDGVLYFSTPSNRVIALDAESSKEI